MIKNFIFLGAPGVGKGTLAKMLAEEKNMIHISTGDIFRKNIQEKTPLGLKVKAILDSGAFVSDEITNEIIKDALNTQEVLSKGFILDGYPRTINQAEFLKSNNIQIDAAVLLDASDELVMSRLLGRAQKENRADDTPEVIANRIKVYNEKTLPLINWYAHENLLKKIDASGDIQTNYEVLLREIF